MKDTSLLKFVMTVAEFNAMQEAEYQKHVAKLRESGVEPTSRDREYFDKCDYKTGYVLPSKFGFTWKRRKKDFII